MSTAQTSTDPLKSSFIFNLMVDYKSRSKSVEASARLDAAFSAMAEQLYARKRAEVFEKRNPVHPV